MGAIMLGIRGRGRGATVLVLSAMTTLSVRYPVFCSTTVERHTLPELVCYKVELNHCMRGCM